MLWAGGSVTPFSSAVPSAAQREVHFLALRRSADWLNRMLEVDVAPDTPESAWRSFEDLASAPPLGLRADLVDLPEVAATCDPTGLLGHELYGILDNPQAIVPQERIGHAVHGIPKHSRTEYVLLIAKELKLGKLVLLTDASGIGTVFAVPKPGGRQRAVWHGTLVSEASPRPVRPRRLGTPEGLLALDWPAGTRVRWSKRDAASFFDTLLCPPSMCTWFGRPAVTVAELLDVGRLTRQDLLRFSPEITDGVLERGQRLFPCSQVWPMGYSWSSAVAQDVSLGLVRAAGFDETQVICVEEQPPLDQNEVMFVLTDDCIMAHTQTFNS